MDKGMGFEKLMRTEIKKEFYYVECEHEEYNLIFHVPSSRFAKVSKTLDFSQYSKDSLKQKFNFLGNSIQTNSILKKGEGKIGLTFMSARTCNLRCKYCFAGEGKYGDFDNKPKMFSIESYIKAIKQAMRMYPDGIKSISFFGGEPLLNIENIKQFIPRCVEIFKEKNLEVPKMAISTNLIAMTDEIAQFLSEYKIHCVISLDGPKELNDIARISYDEKYSVYDHVVKACHILDKYNISYAMQATINRHHLENYKKGDAVVWIKEIEKINWSNLAIIPVETDDEELCIKGNNLNKLDEFTREITNYYIKKLFSKDNERIASGIVAPIVQLINNKHLRDCTSGHSVFVDTDEKVYPCHMFCNHEEYCIGDLEGNWNEELINNISNCDRTEVKECAACIARNVCSVFCKGIQLNSNGSMYSICKPRCVFQRANMEECLKAIAELDRNTEEYQIFLMNFKRVGEYLRKNGFIDK